MKKLLSLLLAICMCLSVGVMLTACDKKHTHTYKTEWANDTTHHWHECKDENCTEVSDKAEHTVVNGVCSVCGYKPDDGSKEMTREEISTVYKTVANEAYKKLGFNAESSKAATNKSQVAAMSIKSLPEIGQEATVAESQGLGFAVSFVAIADMVGDLYANPEFTLTDNVVTFDVAGTPFSLLPVLDRENNRVYIEFMSTTTEESNPINYLVLDFSFNFSSNTLDAMTLGLFMGNAEAVKPHFYVRMTDNKFYWLGALGGETTDEYESTGNELYIAFNVKKQNEIRLTADFSTEYAAYMQTVQKGYSDAMNGGNR